MAIEKKSAKKRNKKIGVHKKVILSDPGNKSRCFNEKLNDYCKEVENH